MPTVHNGIGTWYYGKSNIHRRADYCAHCNRAGELQSYDTTLYFVVFFVPVIPLGGKRILEQCPSCQRHHVVNMKHWQRTKDNAIAEAGDRLEANPPDPEAINNAIAASVQFQHEPLLDDTLTVIAKAPDLGTAELVRLTDALSFFSRWSEAEQACRAALERAETPPIKRKLALILLKQGRPAEAEPLLENVLQEGAKENIGLIDLLIQGYQGEGMHSQALAVMDRALQAFPDLAKEKSWKARRKLSVRHQDSGKRVASGYLNESSKVGSAAGGWTSRLPRIIFPMLLVAGLCAYLSSALWIGSNRKVYLVNGTMSPYAVDVNGTEQKLNPGQVIPMRVREGDVTLRVLDNHFPSDPLVCRIETSFLSRPFANRTFVINPDQSAILLWEEIEYVPKGQPQPAASSNLSVAKLLHEFKNVNYEFVDFPRTLTVKENQSAKKTRVDMIPGLSGMVRLQLVMSNLDEPGQLAYARRRLALEPRDTLTLGWFIARVPAEEALALLRPRLGDRPINVDWHRFYQNLMEETHPEHDLVPEYKKIAAETPRTPDALYLLARASDSKESLKLLEEAAKAEVPSTAALSSLGFRNLSAGRFKEAVGYLSKANPQAAPESHETLLFLSALQAAGVHDQLKNRLQQLEQAPGFFWFARIARVKELAATGDVKAARALIEETRSQNSNLLRLGDLIRQMEAAQACGTYDIPAYLKTVSSEEAKTIFWPLILQGDLRAAADIVQKDSHLQAAAQHALLYLHAQKKNNAALAKSQWSLMLADLEQGNRELRTLAKLLAGATPPEYAALKELPIDPEQKRVFLRTAAQRFPTSDKEIVTLARRLDFQRDETSLCLKSLDGK